MASMRVVGLVLAAAGAVGAMGACGDDGGGSVAAVVDEQPDAGPPVRADFGLDTRPSNTTCKAPARPPSTAPVKFVQVFANVSLLGGPMMMVQIPGDSSRWFVALRGTGDGGYAKIVSFPTTNPGDQPTEVGRVEPLYGISAGEGGLLGIAFHPKFAQNGKLYVSWTRQGGVNGMQSEIGVLTSTDNGNSFGNYQTVLQFDQTPAGNHKGGCITFGNDGYLYASFGDGGGGDDTYVNGQTKTGFFSKILRLDVDNPSGGKAYGIPADNPFANTAGFAPEVFAWGLRNPFRFSIDRATNQVWVGDVGQNQYEEVDKVVPGGNYGWPCREGLHDYITTTTSAQHCPSMQGLLDPVIEYPHLGKGMSITGGVVYRGKAIPSFVGTYIYGDYSQQQLWAITVDPATGKATSTQLNTPDPVANWVHFAEDNDGEVYAVALNQGTVFKMVPADTPAPTSAFPDRLSKTGCVDPNDPKKPAAGVIPYTVSSPLWSDGAKKERFLAIPDGTTITVKDDGDFDFPVGTVLMKNFAVADKRTETRLFIRHDDGNWGGYSYEWLDDESDAVLLPSSKSKPVGAQTWYYPSRGECLACHSEAAGRALGPELGQLNGDFTYTSTNRISNQLATLDHIGIFSAPLGRPVDQIVAYPDPLGTAPVDQRARAYLHANCSHCHRPNGPGLGDMDLRFATGLPDTKTCNVDPAGGDIGVAGAKRIVPGDPSKSLISLRPHSLVANRMPPLASSVVDDKGLSAIDDWIRSLTACP